MTTPEPQLSARVVLDDRTLINLSRNPAVLTAFPFLRAIHRVQAARGKGCGRCAAKAAARKQLDLLAGIKRTVASLSADQKRTLKSLLKTRQVLLVYSAAGKAIEHKF